MGSGLTVYLAAARGTCPPASAVFSESIPAGLSTAAEFWAQPRRGPSVSPSPVSRQCQPLKGEHEKAVLFCVLSVRAGVILSSVDKT